MAIYFAEILCVDKQLSKHLFIKYWKCRQAPDITMILCSNNYDGDEKERTFVQFFFVTYLAVYEEWCYYHSKNKAKNKKIYRKKEKAKESNKINK